MGPVEMRYGAVPMNSTGSRSRSVFDQIPLPSLTNQSPNVAHLDPPWGGFPHCCEPSVAPANGTRSRNPSL
jgi:hypothetical protein